MQRVRKTATEGYHHTHKATKIFYKTIPTHFYDIQYLNIKWTCLENDFVLSEWTFNYLKIFINIPYVETKTICR